MAILNWLRGAVGAPFDEARASEQGCCDGGGQDAGDAVEQEIEALSDLSLARAQPGAADFGVEVPPAAIARISERSAKKIGGTDEAKGLPLGCLDHHPHVAGPLQRQHGNAALGRLSSYPEDPAVRGSGRQLERPQDIARAARHRGAKSRSPRR